MLNTDVYMQMLDMDEAWFLYFDKDPLFLGYVNREVALDC